jgi:hypothetical protein
MNFPFRILVLGVGVFTLVLCMGSKEEEAKTNSTNPKPAAQEAATPAPDAKPAPATPAPKPAESTNAATSTNAAALTDVVSVLFSTNVLGQPVLPASLKLSTPLSDVVKLIQAGVGEDVLMAFITGAADPFDASSDAIIYLHDLGVSSNVITALIQHDASPEMQAKIKTANAVKPLPPGVALGTPATNIYVPKEPAATVQNPPEPQPVNPPGTVSDTASPVPVTGSYTTEEPAEAYDNSNTAISYNYWYSNLAPYGSWVDVGGYGPCWRPPCLSAILPGDRTRTPGVGYGATPAGIGIPITRGAGVRSITGAGPARPASAGSGCLETRGDPHGSAGATLRHIAVGRPCRRQHATIRGPDSTSTPLPSESVASLGWAPRRMFSFP